jgi:hypothetical protein
MKIIGIVCLGVSVSLLLILCWYDALFISIPIKPSLCAPNVKLALDGTCGYDKIVSPWFVISGLIALFGLLSMFGARFYHYFTKPVKSNGLRRKQNDKKKNPPRRKSERFPISIRQFLNVARNDRIKIIVSIKEFLMTSKDIHDRSIRPDN